MYELSNILFFIVSEIYQQIYIELGIFCKRYYTLRLLTPNFSTELPITVPLQIHIFTEFLSLWMLSPKSICLSLNTIKKKLNTFLWNHFMDNFDSNNFTLSAPVTIATVTLLHQEFIIYVGSPYIYYELFLILESCNIVLYLAYWYSKCYTSNLASKLS